MNLHVVYVCPNFFNYIRNISTNIAIIPASFPRRRYRRRLITERVPVELIVSLRVRCLWNPTTQVSN